MKSLPPIILLCVLLQAPLRPAAQTGAEPGSRQAPGDSVQQRLRREFSRYLSRPQGRRAVSFRGRIDAGARQTFLSDGSPAEQPTNYLRLGGQGTLTVYGVPLSLSSNISTEQVPFRQPMNLLNIGLDTDALRRSLQDRGRRLAEARARGMLTQLPDAVPGQAPEIPTLPSEAEMRERIAREAGEAAARQYARLQDSAAGRLQDAARQDSLAAQLTAGARNSADLARADSARTDAARARQQAAGFQDSALAVYARADAGYARAQARYRQARQLYDQRRADLDSLRSIGRLQAPGAADSLPGGGALPDGLATRAERLLSAVEIFKIGRMVVNSTRFTALGAPVTGFQIAARPVPRLYLEAAGSKNLRPTDPDGATASYAAAARDLGLLRVGWGSPTKGYVRLNMLYAEDRRGTAALAAPAGLVLPEQNAVSSLEFLVPLGQGRASVEGEVATSLSSRNTRVERFGADDAATTPFQRAGVRGVVWNDKAIVLRGAFQPWKGGRATATGTQVGTGFRTLGNVFLRGDYRSGQLDFDQTVLRGRLKISVVGALERNNLLGLLAQTARRRTLGGGGTAVVKRVLQVGLRYMDSDVMLYADSAAAAAKPWVRQQAASGSLAHTWRAGGWALSEAYTVDRTDQASETDVLDQMLWNHNLLLAGQHRKGWRVGLQAQHTSVRNEVLPVALYTLGASGGYARAQGLSLLASGAYTLSRGTGWRAVAALEARVPLAKWLAWNSRAEYTRFGLRGRAFGLCTGTTGLVATW